MAEAGCVRVATGIENGDDTLRQTILAKNITSDQIQKRAICIFAWDPGRRAEYVRRTGETVDSALATIELNLAAGRISTPSFFAPFRNPAGEICQEQYGFSGDLRELPKEFQENWPQHPPGKQGTDRKNRPVPTFHELPAFSGSRGA